MNTPSQNVRHNTLSGLPWATTSSVAVGSKLKADGGFTCIKDGAIVTVNADGNDLYVQCSDGKHDLSGQLGDLKQNADCYVGFTHAGA